jgi:hypothetical protein
MNWPMSFSIVGTIWGLAYIIGRYTEFKKYHIDELVYAVKKLERDVAELRSGKGGV